MSGPPKGMSRQEFFKWLTGGKFPGVTADDRSIGDAYADYKAGRDIHYNQQIVTGEHNPSLGDVARHIPVPDLSGSGRGIFESSGSHGSTASTGDNAQAPQGAATPQATPGSTTPGNPSSDTSAVKTGNSALDQSNAQAAADTTANGQTINLFGNGVDPNAKVYTQLSPERLPQRTRGPQGGDIIAKSPYEAPVMGEQTAQDALLGLYKMTPQQVLALQHRMWDQGWYQGTNITDPKQLDGRIGPDTMDAYGAVLGQAARAHAAGAIDPTGQPLTVDDILNTGQPRDGRKTAGSGAGGPYTTTNPADYKKDFRDTAVALTGKEQGSEADRYAAQAIASEAASKAQYAQMAVDNKTAPNVAPASLGAGSEQYLREHNPDDIRAYGAAARQQAFFQMLQNPTGYKPPLS